MGEGVAGEDSSARRALHEALLQQERFDDLLYGIARFAKRRRDGFDPYRSAAETFGDQFQIALVEGVQPAPVDFQAGECRIGDFCIDAGMAGD